MSAKTVKTARLEKLLAQVAAEKSRISKAAAAGKAAAKAAAAKQNKKQISAAARLAVDAGLAGVPLDFLQRAFAKIAADYASEGAKNG